MCNKAFVSNSSSIFPPCFSLHHFHSMFMIFLFLISCTIKVPACSLASSASWTAFFFFFKMIHTWSTACFFFFSPCRFVWSFSLLYLDTRDFLPLLLIEVHYVSRPWWCSRRQQLLWNRDLEDSYHRSVMGRWSCRPAYYMPPCYKRERTHF